MTSRAELFPELDPETRRRWSKFGTRDLPYFQQFLGMEIVEVRTDYCRMRLPFRREFEQPGGVVHGGVVAALADTVVVPAVGQAYPRTTRVATVDFTVQFHGALIDDGAIAEGWVVRRGKTMVFCESQVTAESTGKLVARSLLTYHVSHASAGS